MKALASVWLLVVIASLMAALGRGVNFDSSILSLLPESEQQPLVQQASDKLGDEFSARLLLLVTGTDDAATRGVVAALAEDLSRQKEVARVLWRLKTTEIAGLRNEMFAYRFVVIEAGLRRKLNEGKYQEIARQALLNLFGPVGMGAGSVVEDPFGFYIELQKERAENLNIVMSDSMLKVANSSLPTYLVSLELNGDPFSPALQDKLLSRIDQLRAQFAGSIDRIRMSGMLLHAAAGAQQAKAEITTIGLGSLIGIALAMLLVFGRPKPLFLMLLAVAIGCTFATAVTLLLFGRIHLITLAFGAGLVGVSIDYALHYLCERCYFDADRARANILAGLLMGLFSSVMAYAAMLLTPFPGLRQMACFTVAGLFAAWLTVVLWLPALTRRDVEQAPGLAAGLGRFRDRFPRIEHSRWLQLTLALALALSLAFLWQAEGRDDIRLLQTSPDSLLSQEQEVQRLLGNPSSSQFLLVSAASLDLCLQIEENLAPALNALVAEGVIGGYQAVSGKLPSLQRQQENYALVTELYRDQLASFFDTLNFPRQRLLQSQAHLREAAALRLTPQHWRQLAASEAYENLILEPSATSAATVIRISGLLDDRARLALNALAAGADGVVFVDRVDDISRLLAKFRIQIGKWLILAYLIVALVLFWRYRMEAWRILLPPMLASIVTLAILVKIYHGINLFHLLALMLVLGLGLDMRIFLSETNEAAHTWLAVSLSAYTSLLAFGLLALSDTPVLHHFGITVAIGLGLVWLMAPTVRPDARGAPV